MSWAIWITGRPGSGKSALARATAVALRALGEPVTVLELDDIHRTLAPGPPGSDHERELVHRALTQVAVTVVREGVPVIVDGTADQRAWRDAARALIPRFAEVLLIGNASGGSGADLYELPLTPELYLDIAGRSSDTVAAEVVELARRFAAETAPRRGLGRGGCVIWIAGRPGSGKTTLARGVGAMLAAEDVPVVVLELAPFRHALQPPARGVTGLTEDVAHRAIICAAKVLVGAGLTVIVDAATPRRAWRELARRTISAFAEVQLICPSEVSIEREWAERWKPAEPPKPYSPPEVYPDYEEPATPDVIVNTYAVGRVSAVRQVVEMARRLARSSRGEPT
ncbi:MAG TPA: adenylyl-sulfate kinase [Candidatus Limnocylindrales bacterium]|nr:adenylyl-sulfate kinase [Candidatus Limnocylindrales bacterium]